MKTSAVVLALAALSAGSALKPRASSLPSIEVKGNGKTIHKACRTCTNFPQLSLQAPTDFTFVVLTISQVALLM